jgi:hypothetical protein
MTTARLGASPPVRLSVPCFDLSLARIIVNSYGNHVFAALGRQTGKPIARKSLQMS